MDLLHQIYFIQNIYEVNKKEAERNTRLKRSPLIADYSVYNVIFVANVNTVQHQLKVLLLQWGEKLCVPSEELFLGL
jgi:deoxyadenosine/deoxycytidine kinase